MNEWMAYRYETIRGDMFNIFTGVRMERYEMLSFSLQLILTVAQQTMMYEPGQFKGMKVKRFQVLLNKEVVETV